MWTYAWLLLLPPLAVVVAFFVLSAMARRPTNLGVRDGKLAPCPASPNCVSTQATDAYHRIEPIRFAGSAGDVMARLKRVLATLPRTVMVTETADYLHVECTSFLFRFVDDVEFWIDDASKLIHFRSASRVGRRDFGVNRRRMETIRRAFQSALGAGL